LLERGWGRRRRGRRWRRRRSGECSTGTKGRGAGRHIFEFVRGLREEMESRRECVNVQRASGEAKRGKERV